MFLIWGFMNIYLDIFVVHIFLFLSGKYLMVVKFIRNCQNIFQSACSILHFLPTNIKHSGCSICSPILYVASCLIFVILVGVHCYLIRNLICISLNTSDVKDYSCLIGHLCILSAYLHYYAHSLFF